MSIDRMPATARQHGPVLVFLGVMGVSLATLLLLPPIVQDQDYLRFADMRIMCGVPNGWNVLSNIPFIVIGAIGLVQFRNDPVTVVIFAGMFMTGVGSSYFHWWPDNDTLFWDRLPIALAFMALLAAAIQERLDARAGAVLLWPLLAIAIASLLLWRQSGDLRLYAWVQFFPLLTVPAMFLLCAPKYTGAIYWLAAAALYAFAKVFEHFDNAIFSIGHVVSGHTLKHLVAAAACFAVLRYFQTRQPITA
jgi:hypothetical protein